MTCEEYLNAVRDVIKNVFVPNDPSGSMTVATVALAVHSHIPCNFRDFGYRKFREVLTELERRGDLRTGTNSRGAYALWLAGHSTSLTKPATNTSKRARSLRNVVWRAFVSADSSVRHFMNHAGEVVASAELLPSPEWAQIPSIDDSQEKDIARQWVATKQLPNSDELLAAIDGEKWYASFPLLLEKIDKALFIQWKRERSERVMSAAEHWIKEKSLPPALLFENKQVKVNSIQEGSLTLRESLLEAIGQMPTEQLLSIAIPPALLISVLRPDLMQR